MCLFSQSGTNANNYELTEKNGLIKMNYTVCAVIINSYLLLNSHMVHNMVAYMYESKFAGMTIESRELKI